MFGSTKAAAECPSAEFSEFSISDDSAKLEKPASSKSSSDAKLSKLSSDAKLSKLPLSSPKSSESKNAFHPMYILHHFRWSW